MRFITDQVRPVHAQQGIPQQGPVRRVMVAQESFVQLALLRRFHRGYAVAFVAHPAQGVFLGVVHRGGRGHWRWIKGLDLVGAKAIFLEP